MLPIHDIKVDTQDPEFFGQTIDERLAMLNLELKKLDDKMKKDLGYQSPRPEDPPRELRQCL